MATLPKGTARAIDKLRAAVDSGDVLPTTLVKEIKKEFGKELGISGTTNWIGDIQSESNAELIHSQAYGRPGSRTWGEWETIIRTDPDVACALDFTAAQLRDARVDVKEASEEMQPDHALAKAQADFVRWNLTKSLEPGWPEVVQQMTRGSLGYGFSLHEVVMQACTHPLLPGGSGYKVAKLAERLPVSVHINGWIEENGDLAYVHQWGPRNGEWADVMLEASRLLLVSWNRTGNNYPGFSAFRSVWYICKIRRHLLKLTGIALTREGAGIPTAWAQDPKTPLTKSQRSALQRLLSNNVYHENAAVVMPAGWKLDWVFSPGANKGHVVDAWERLGTVILRQLNAQQMELGTNGTGSLATGKMHNSVADAFAQGVVANIEGVLNGQGQRAYTGLVRKLVDANWGPQAAYPEIALTLKKSKLAPKDKADAANVAKQAGLLTPTLDDENAMREDLGFGPIDEETRDAEKQKAVEQAQKAMQPQTDPSAGRGGPDDKSKPATVAPFAKARANRGPFVPHRELRASEKHLDLTAIDDFLAGQKDAFERGARPLILEMLGKAIPDIRAAMADGDPSEISGLALDDTRLASFVSAFLKKARTEGYRQMAKEFRRGKTRAGSADEKDPPATDAPDEVDAVLEAQQKQVVRKVVSRLRTHLEDAAIDVVRTNGDPDEVVSEVVQSQIETTALARDAGMVVTKAFNMGRDEFAQEMGDQVDSVELSAILDKGTCAFCERMDGEQADFNSAEHDAMLPPLRDCEGGSQCRCVLVYSFKDAGFAEQ